MAKYGEATKEVDYEKDVDSRDVRNRLIVNRIRMMTKEPFYGTIAINLLLKEVDKDHPQIKTAAVDGKNFFYNPNFIDALDDDEIIFLIGHEIMHCVLRHLTRRGQRDPMMWNQAGDYIINYILVRDGIGKFPEVGGLYDESLGQMTTEQAYDELKQKQQQQGGGGQGQGGGQGDGSNGPGGHGNFDDHIEINVKNDEDSDGEGDSDGSSGSMEVSESEAQQIENDMRSTIMQAAQAARGAGAGKVPAEIERMIDEFTEPKMNWRDFLRENAKSQVRTDYTWKKFNRRYMSAGIYVPGMTVEDHFEFVVGIDASGSMSQEQLRDFLGEIYGIADSFMSFKIGVFTFDTQVYNYQEFDQDSIDELLYYKPKGGGGTDFDCCFEYMKEHDILPETFVMLTDGFPWNSWGDEDYCETIFIIHDQHAISQKVKAPFGTTVYYDDYEF